MNQIADVLEELSFLSLWFSLISFLAKVDIVAWLHVPPSLTSFCRNSPFNFFIYLQGFQIEDVKATI